MTVTGTMKEDYKDRGWAWVIAAACFWTSLTATGILPSYGVLYTILTEELHVSKEAASWPFTVGNAFSGIGVSLNCLLNGFVAIRRQAIVAAILCFFGIFFCYFSTDTVMLCVFFGVINGIGGGILYSSSLVIVCQYFQRYATVATGILYAGLSASCIVYPLLIEYFAELYGVNGCLLIVAGITLNSLVGVLLYHAPPAEDEFDDLPTPTRKGTRRSSFLTGCTELGSMSQLPEEDGVVGKNFKQHLFKELKLWLQVFKYPMFIVITIGFEFYYFSYISYMMILTDNAVDVGIDKVNASLLLSMFAAFDLLGRLCSGWIVDLGWMKVKTLLIVAYTCLGVTYAVTPSLTNYVTLAVSSCVAGYLSGTIGINWTVTINDYLGFKLLSPAIAASGLIYILLSLSLPFLIGHIREAGGNYSVFFYVFGAVQVLSVLMWFLEPMAVKIQKKWGLLRRIA